MYHSVADRGAGDPYLVTVEPERLAGQLRWLRRHGLTGVSMRELLTARARGRADRLVGLTFDDGYADFLAEAVPRLRDHGHTATVFVLAGRLGGTNSWDPEGPRKPLLTAEEVRAAHRAGMEIGSHGLLHRDLTTLDDAELHRELADSRGLLAEITGTPPVGFCHPFGAVDPRTLRATREAGYAYACAVDPGPLACLHALPRSYVGQADNAPRLHAKRLRHRLRGPALPAPAPVQPAVPAPSPVPAPAPNAVPPVPPLPTGGDA